MYPASAMSFAAMNPGRLDVAALAGDSPRIAAVAARAAPPSSWRLVIILCIPVAAVLRKPNLYHDCVEADGRVAAGPL